MNRFLCLFCCVLAVQTPAWSQSTSVPPKPSHDLARSMSAAFADVYERIAPGVVVIESRPGRPAPAAVLNSPYGQFFAPDPGQYGGPREANQGSGFIMTADGYVLTNNHVLGEDLGGKITVVLKDGRKLSAKVVGTDPITDLAVLKVKGKDLPVVELGDSDKTRVGEFAFALGAPFDLRDTFTYGIISAKGRTDLTGSSYYEEFLQTDASINPGNSGGPLVNIDGQVIGVNTLIRDMNRGLGFAIPINIAKKVATQLIADGRAVRPWLGVVIKGIEDLPGDVADMVSRRYPDMPAGVIVQAIEPGAPAEMSDLRRGDVITKVDGVPVASARALQKAIIDRNVGDQIQLEVWRQREGLVKVQLRTAERISGYLPVSHSARHAPLVEDDEAEAESGADEEPTPAPAPRAKAGKTKPQPSPTAGLTVKTLTVDMARSMKLQAEEGVLVTSVQPGSAAAVAGVRVGDVITSVGSEPVSTSEDFLREMRANDGDALMLNLNRGEEKTYGILKF